ncbi:SDR family oxidoreductase [Nonomuraea rhodomycinica]|uniref:NAD(P)H-binding protein n=1 Tax=Nonomuraea rhodomycinica TaxID=1712872 RepID=A0A7Y6M977_9ACTN|nr:NAD(P)H-binding protein [Nonomuraea rhodomycinica]NUW39347.1 NAD(P)H-binding protein [Nonomuraea rhodomycinica]
MTSSILVTGGTGTLGRLVVPLLRAAGREVRVLSRAGREPRDGVAYVKGDVSTGEGLDAAMRGAGTVVHCAGSAKGDDDKARHLVRAATAAGARHLVYISVVGVDRVPVVSGVDRAMFGYFAAKRAAERIVAESGIPWTTLRATQFHDWVLMTLRQLAKLPVVLPTWSGVRFQPVDTGEVAARLAELALGEPAGLVPDLAGPRVHAMEDLARDYLRAAGRRRLVVPMRTPGRAAAAFREGANLAPDRAVGRRTWEDFLAAQARQDL